MTPQGFGVALIVGSGALAFWILWRYSRFGPRTIFWAVINAVIACLLLRAVPLALTHLAASGKRGIEYVEIFAVALPVLVYGFLTGGWVARVALGLLRR